MQSAWRPVSRKSSPMHAPANGAMNWKTPNDASPRPSTGGSARDAGEHGRERLVAGGAGWSAIARSVHRIGPVGSLTALTLQAGRDCPAVSLYVQFDEGTLAVKGSQTQLERVPVVANLRHDQLDEPRVARPFLDLGDAHGPEFRGRWCAVGHPRLSPFDSFRITAISRQKSLIS